MRARQLLRKRKDTNSIWSDISDNDLVDAHKGIRRGLSRFVFSIASLVVVTSICYIAWQMYQMQIREPNVLKVVEKAMNSVVAVECYSTDGEKGSAGTGVVMNVPLSGNYKSGIISASHIFDDCVEGSEVTVIHDGVTYIGMLSKKDPLNTFGNIKDNDVDLALIYIEAEIPVLQPAKEARIGDWAIVIGNPLYLNNYVTVGIIGGVTDSEYITDAATNSGNSGGPVLDSNGDVLGIVSSSAIEEDAIKENQKGIWNFAAGITTVKRLKLTCSKIYSTEQICPFVD